MKLGEYISIHEIDLEASPQITVRIVQVNARSIIFFLAYVLFSSMLSISNSLIFTGEG